jgi:HEAT repeat protein
MMMTHKKMLLLLMAVALVMLCVVSVYAGEIDDLIEQLEKGTRVQREKASEELVYPQGSRAIPQLIQALDSGNDVFRADVAYTLASMGDWQWKLLSGRNLERAVDRLTVALSDSYWRVRANAAFVLRNIGEDAKESEEELVNALGDDDARVRSAVAYALEAIKPESRRTIQALIKCLSDEDRDTRWAAACTLNSIGPDASSAVDQLLVCLNDESKWVRLAAVEALANIGDSSERIIRAVAEAVDEEDERYTRAGSSGYYESVAWDMLNALTTFEEAAIPFLQTIFISGRHRDSIGYALARIGEPAVPALLTMMTECKDPEGKESAAKYLGNIGDAAIPALEKLADSTDPEVRETVAAAFKNSYRVDVRVVNILCKLVKDSDKWVRTAATESLATVGRGTDTRDLIAVGLIDASKDSVTDVRYQAARGLKTIGMPSEGIDVVSSLVILAGDKDAQIRRVATEGLKEQIPYRFRPLSDKQEADVVSVVVRNLSDANEEVRLAAIDAVGPIIDTDMIKDPVPVVRALTDALDTKRLADKAAGALARLGEAARPALGKVMDLMWSTDNSDYQIAVARIGGKTVLSQMIEALEHQNSSHRLNAVKVLFHMGPDAKSAIPAVKRLIEKESVHSVKFFAENATLPQLESGESIW